MGWTGVYSMQGHKTPKAYLDAELVKGGGQSDYKVLRSTTVGRVYYAAVERTLKSDGTSYVFAAVVLFKHRPRARDGEVFLFKQMDESMGPCEADCPKAILHLLSPTDKPAEVAWRQKCVRNVEARSKRKKLEAGMKIRLKEGLRLKGGEVIDTFTVKVLRRRNRNRFFFESPSGLLYAISNIHDRGFMVIETPTTGV
jgi:hypothetical protein